VAQPPPQPSAPPADWKGPASAWNDLHNAREAKRTAEAALESERAALAVQRAELTAAAAAAKAEAATWQARHVRDTTLLEAPDLPASFRHPRMRERLWGEYEAHRAAQGDKALEFSAFVPTLKDDPLYGAHFVTQAQPDAIPALPQLPPQAPPLPATGTVQPTAGTPVAYTETMINRLRAEGQWRAGRINVVTGEPEGGSPHWQAHMRALSRGR